MDLLVTSDCTQEYQWSETMGVSLPSIPRSRFLEEYQALLRKLSMEYIDFLHLIAMSCKDG